MKTIKLQVLLIFLFFLLNCTNDNKVKETNEPKDQAKESLKKIELDSLEIEDWDSRDKTKDAFVEEITIANDGDSLFQYQLTSFTNLKKLHLFACSYKQLPETIGNVKTLEELILYYTDILELPSNISNLKHLKKLMINKHDCYNISLCDFDLGDWICELESLEELTFVDCIIPQLPNCMKNLKSLKKFNYKHSSFDEFPTVLTEIPSLEYIFILNNKQLEIPSEIKDNKNLRYEIVGM